MYTRKYPSVWEILQVENVFQEGGGGGDWTLIMLKGRAMTLEKHLKIALVYRGHLTGASRRKSAAGLRSSEAPPDANNNLMWWIRMLQGASLAPEQRHARLRRDSVPKAAGREKTSLLVVIVLCIAPGQAYTRIERERCGLRNLKAHIHSWKSGQSLKLRRNKFDRLRPLRSDEWTERKFTPIWGT